jgi:hypothetical protein
MAPRCCVYTALYGNFDKLPEQPVRAASAVDFIAFVGDPALASRTWTVRHLPPRLPGDPVRSARFVKTHPHILLPDYDASLYIDCTVMLKQPPEALFDGLLFGRSETMACFRNNQRDNVPDEALTVLNLGYDDPDVYLRQLRAYADTEYRGIVPLIWGGLLLRFHHHASVVAMMERWWEHVLRYSRRDQLSFSYLAEILDFPFVGHALDNENSVWHSWPVSRSRVRAPWSQPHPVPLTQAASPFQLKLHQTIDRIAALCDQARKPLDDAGVSLVLLQAERDRLKRELAEMARRPAWRLTAPVRRLLDAVFGR